MADQPPTGETTDPGSTSEMRRLEAFFETKKIDDHCPFCATENWQVIGQPDVTAAVLTVNRSNGGVGTRPPHLPVYLLVCENCGFIRMHSRQVIDAQHSPPKGDVGGG